MKKIYIFIALSLVIMIGFSVVAKGQFKEGYYDKYTSLDSLLGANVYIGEEQYFISDFFKSESWSNIETAYNYFYEETLDNYNNVIIVHATGELKFGEMSVIQSVVVDKVIRGDGVVGEKASYIWSGKGIKFDEQSQHFNICAYGNNFMQIGYEYILFCDTSDMSNYSDDTFYQNRESELFSYFRLSDEYYAATYNKNLKYKDCYLYEIFVEDSDSVVDIMSGFKHYVLNKYKNEISEYYEIG